MGKRARFGQRKQVLQLNEQPTYGFGYRPTPAQSSGMSALSGLVTNYGQSSDESDQEEEEYSSRPSSSIQFVSGATQPGTEGASSASSADAVPKAGSANLRNGHENSTKKTSGDVNKKISGKNDDNTISKKDDIDTKVLDFLAEIDAFDTDTKKDDEGKAPLPDTPPCLTGHEKSDEDTNIDEDAEKDHEVLEEPKEPTTMWHHLMDEATQCPYYWNTETNEVQWMIPAEYTQHLLRMRQYEEDKERYEMALAERAKKDERKQKKTVKDGHITTEPQSSASNSLLGSQKLAPKGPDGVEQSIKNEQVEVPIGPQLAQSETSQDNEPSHLSSSEFAPPLSDFGPQLPTSDFGPQLPSYEFGPQLPQAEFGPSLPSADFGPQLPLVEFGPPLPPTNFEPSLPPAEFGPQMQSDELGPQLPVRAVSDVSKLDLLSSLCSDGVEEKAEPLQSHPPRGPDHVEFTQKADEDNNHDESHDNGRVSVDSDTMKPTQCFTKSTKRRHADITVTKQDVNAARMTDYRHPAMKTSEPLATETDHKHQTVKTDVDAINCSDGVKTQVEVTCEEPPVGDILPVQNIAVAKKSNQEDVDDTFELADDEIDMQLEMALEKKKGELRLLERSEVPHDDEENVNADVDCAKRKTALDEPCIKRPKITDMKKIPLLKKRIEREEIKQRIDALTEIPDLSSLVIDKLDFLEVTHQGLSRLQILLVQLETRLADWREGGLSSDHMLLRLREAAAQLRQYETSAPPSGWTCHWDRSYKRYFYCHTTTGYTQWDYPEPTDSDEHTATCPPSEALINDINPPEPEVLSSDKLLPSPTEVKHNKHDEAQQDRGDAATEDSGKRRREYDDEHTSERRCRRSRHKHSHSHSKRSSSKRTDSKERKSKDKHRESRSSREHVKSREMSTADSVPDDEMEKIVVKMTSPDDASIVKDDCIPTAVPVEDKPLEPVNHNEATPLDNDNDADVDNDNDADVAGEIDMDIDGEEMPPSPPVVDSTGRIADISAPPQTYVSSSHEARQEPAEKTAAAPPVAKVGTTAAAVAAVVAPHKEKTKKKDKKLVLGGSGRSMKKVPSLVEKWQKVQKEAERERSKDSIP